MLTKPNKLKLKVLNLKKKKKKNTCLRYKNNMRYQILKSKHDNIIEALIGSIITEYGGMRWLNKNAVKTTNLACQQHSLSLNPEPRSD